MRRGLVAAVLAVTGLASCSAGSAALQEGEGSDSTALGAPVAPVIGTFDSRCVALAYYRSEESLAALDAMMMEYEKAVAAGDSLAARELDSLGRDRQDRMHAQVFSAADADEVIWEIWDVIPEVAAEAGVDVIVSEWDVIYSDSLFAPVDVTDFLVRRFHPTEETLGIITQMKGMPAVPPQLLSPDV